MMRVHLRQEWELQKLAQWAEPRLDGQAVWGYDSEFDYGCGYDGESVFLPDRHPVGVGALGKIVRLPSFLGMASCNGEVMPNVEDGTVANAFYNRTLQ